MPYVSKYESPFDILAARRLWLLRGKEGVMPPLDQPATEHEEPTRRLLVSAWINHPKANRAGMLNTLDVIEMAMQLASGDHPFVL